MRPATLLRIATALIALAGAAGCGTVLRLEPPPADAAETLPILGIPNARFWPDGPPAPLAREATLMLQRQRATARSSAPAPANFLALSGGGDNGAFGAGLLVGWTAAGSRPTFDIVTGISAGALIAPFAFLGPEYDAQLREVFTEVAPRDVLLLNRIPFALLFGTALADTSPLYRLIERQADERMLQAIAREYLRGRLLLIGTTNLDLERPVIWNIGAIAASGHPQALRLFREVLLASASIPGAFPPVLIDVEHDGQRRQEMHVDGGAATQVFLYPPSLDTTGLSGPHLARRQRTIWVVRNGRMDAVGSNANRGLVSIASRSIATLLHFSGVGDVSRIHLTALRDGIGFELAYIGPDFQAARSEPFDQGFMRALFDYGAQKILTGNAWVTAPPAVGTLRSAPAR